MKAHIYLRVSTDEQGVSGLGLEAQRKACEAAAEHLGASSIAVYEDVGFSGAAEIEDRPGLASLLGCISKGDVLIVAKRDRIARDAGLAAIVERMVAKKRATLVSAAGEGSGGDDISSLIVRRMADVFSEVERMVIRTRTKDALSAKKARGERVGSIPYGYRLGADGKRLEPADDEQAVISTVVEFYGTLSTRSIANRLNESGVRSRTGNPWTKTQITRILTKWNQQQTQCAG